MDNYYDPPEYRKSLTAHIESDRPEISWELCFRCELVQFLPFLAQSHFWHSSVIVKERFASAVSVVDTNFLYRLKIPQDKIEQAFVTAIKEIQDVFAMEQYEHVFQKRLERVGGTSKEDLTYTLQQLIFVFPVNLRKRLEMPKVGSHATGVYSVKLQHLRYEDDALDKRSHRRQAGREYLFRGIQEVLFDGRDYFVTTSIIDGQSEDPFLGDYYEIEIMTLEIYLLSPETCNVDELFIDFKGIFPEINKEPVPVEETPESFTTHEYKGMMFVPLIKNVWRRVA